ncbi:hypothetical protein D3C84_928710 [compost metagenome]
MRKNRIAIRATIKAVRNPVINKGTSLMLRESQLSIKSLPEAAAIMGTAIIKLNSDAVL